MAGNEVNPFADPNEINPFADPSITAATGGTNKGIGEYNPFAVGGSTTNPAVSASHVPQNVPVTQPATIEPTRSPEQPPAYSPYGVNQREQENLRQRQEELEKKAAELQRKEEELKTLQQQVHRENNFPPLPKKFPVQPCFYHDINIDIPIEYQKTCRMMFYLWQLYCFTLFYNLICALALLCVGGDSGATTFGVALLYFVLFIPCSFVLWYRPFYQALKNDSSFNFMLFFFIFFFQIMFTIVYALGIPSFGTCGWINAAKAMDNSHTGVAAMMMICGALWTIEVIFQILLLKRVHTYYRTSGASLDKAQSEFARGVISNKNVQNAAAEAARGSVQAAATRH